MGKRKEIFVNGGIYHVYNRGAHKYNIFRNKADQKRFLNAIEYLNDTEPSVSLTRKINKNKNARGEAPYKKDDLVKVHAYCLNQNHFHLLIEQVENDGVSVFMQKLGTSYTNYFNTKYEKKGVLFSGPFKAICVQTDTYLTLLFAYINFNYLIHGIDEKRIESSKDRYYGKKCDNLVSRDQFEHFFKSRELFENFCFDQIKGVLKRRQKDEEVEKVYLEEI